MNMCPEQWQLGPDYKGLFERLQAAKDVLEKRYAETQEQNKALQSEVDELRKEAGGLHYKPWFLDKAGEEEFNAIAYAYRSWPMSDPKGVAERYGELLRHVGKIIENCR